MRWFKWWICIILILFTIVNPTRYSSSAAQENLKVHFIDVGQGDSILIQTPNEKNILIDGGPPKSGKIVVDFLNDHHVKKIDLLIVTHPDIDHVGGLITVMKSIKIDKIIDSGKLHTTNTYAKYVDQILKHEIPVEIAKQDEQISMDPRLRIRILNTHNGKKNNNQSSIVLKVSYREIDFLLMGDSERKQEERLMKTNDLESEIFKVGHHGSKTSTSFPFVDLVNPKVAIITYSKKNKYGHPVDRVIRNLFKVDANIFSTAVFGHITIITDGNGYFVMTEKDPIDGLTEDAG